MARDFAKKFYASPSWKSVRAAYYSKAQGLCERCLENGLIVPGEIVHHKIHLTADNIDDSSISLDFNNLELLCRDCHAKEHEKEYNLHSTVKKRYKFDALGRIIYTNR